MSTSLPPLLTDHDLPHVELQAIALDGDVFRLDRAFCSVAEFDVPWRRASVFGVDRASLVVAGVSAAWVWGALALAPTTHEAFRRRGKHGDDPPGFRVRTVAVDPSDVVDFGSVVVTSPTRTVVDLCRGEGYDGASAAVVERLVAEHRVERAGCEAVLRRTRHLPHRNRALARLVSVGFGGGGREAASVRAPSG